MTTRVTAVVVTWDSAADVGGCLRALLRQRPPVDVVVVDNGSTDDTLVRVERIRRDHSDRILVLRNPHNAGFAAAVNRALDADADGDAVLLVNPDVRLLPDHVATLVAALAADERLGSVQGTLWRPRRAGVPRVLDSTGHRAYRTRLFGNRDEGATTPSPGGRVFGVTGAAALHRRAMLDDVALRRPDGTREWLDETLFAFYDDVDLDWRARLRGWEAAHVPRAVGVHARGGAAARRTRHVEVLNAANRLLVVAKLDDRDSLLRAAPAVLAGTGLKTSWLLLRDPPALPALVRRLRAAWGPTMDRRRQVMARATVSPAAVVAAFEPFDWRAWVRRWWRRTRAPRPTAG